MKWKILLNFKISKRKTDVLDYKQCNFPLDGSADAETGKTPATFYSNVIPTSRARLINVCLCDDVPSFYGNRVACANFYCGQIDNFIIENTFTSRT